MRKSLLSSKGFNPPRSHGDSNNNTNANNSTASFSPPERSAFVACRGRLSGHFNANRHLPSSSRASNGGNQPVDVKNADIIAEDNADAISFMDNTFHKAAEGASSEGGGSGVKRRRAWSAVRERLDDDANVKEPFQDLTPPQEEGAKELETSEQGERERGDDAVVALQGFPACVSALEQASLYFSTNEIEEEEEEGSLAREVEEERRMSEDLPFTPHLALSPPTSQPTESHRFDGHERREVRFSLSSDGEEGGGARPAPGDRFAGSLAPTSAPVPFPPSPRVPDEGGGAQTRTTFIYSSSCSNSRPAEGEEKGEERGEAPPPPRFVSARWSSPSPARRAPRTHFVLPSLPPASGEPREGEEGGGPRESREEEGGEGGGKGASAAAGGAWYDLPPEARHFFTTRRGIRALYGWQDALLSRAGLRRGGSLLYGLPTGGGKTLLAEISLLRCLLNRRRSGLFVLPYVALAEEKAGALQAVGTALGFPVDGHYGSTGRFPLSKAPALWVCTIEKANSLLNGLLEEGRGEELGCVVVDELHMLGEARRGATLELLLMKLLLLSERRSRPPPSDDDDDGMAPPPNPLQILAMSATIPNLPVLARWLGADCYEGSSRPVPLVQYSVVDGLVLRDGVRCVRSLSTAPNPGHPPCKDGDELYELATELAEGSVLVFCASRQQCVDAARGLVRYLARKLMPPPPPPPPPCGGKGPGEGKPTPGPLPLPTHDLAGLTALREELEALSHSEPSAGSSLLLELVPYGVGFHHGGLLVEERELLERAYRRRLVRVLCCTSTLAAGVNLPARRVIFKTPFIGREFLTKARYVQMCGRAGRPGMDAQGESFLLLRRRDREAGRRLLEQDLEPCVSQALEEVSQLPRMLLECIGIGLLDSRAKDPGSPGGVDAAGWARRMLFSSAPGPIDEAFFPILQRTLARRGRGPESGGVDGNADVLKAANMKELRAAMTPQGVLGALVEATLESLIAKGFVVEDELAEDPSADPSFSFSSSSPRAGRRVRLRVTPFGASSVRSCFSVEEALFVREELDRLRRTGLILADDLHLCYFMAPPREAKECDWGLYREHLARLDDDRQRIASLIGVDEYLVDQLAMGIGLPSSAASFSFFASSIFDPSSSSSSSAAAAAAGETGRQSWFIARRFYLAMMLSDILAEVPLSEVERRYSVQRGQLQALMRSVSMYSSSITNFCRAMEWFSLEAVLASFVKRLGFGVKPDLLPLMEVKGVQPPRARALWNAGFRTPAQLAAVASPEELVDRVKAMNRPDNRAARYFTKRSALMVIHAASLMVQAQIQQKMDELEELKGKHS